MSRPEPTRPLFTVEPRESWCDVIRQHATEVERIELQVRTTNRAGWESVRHWTVEVLDVLREPKTKPTSSTTPANSTTPASSPSDDDPLYDVPEVSVLHVHQFGNVSPYELAGCIKAEALAHLDSKKTEKGEPALQLHAMIILQAMKGGKLVELDSAQDVFGRDQIPPGLRADSIIDPGTALVVDANHMWRALATESRGREREEYVRRRKAEDKCMELVFDKGVTIFNALTDAVGQYDARLTEARNKYEKASADKKTETEQLMDHLGPWVPEILSNLTGRAVPGVNCPGCNTASPRNAKFCSRCGAGLTIECAGCHESITTADQYCPNCGRDQKAAS